MFDNSSKRTLEVSLEGCQHRAAVYDQLAAVRAGAADAGGGQVPAQGGRLRGDAAHRSRGRWRLADEVEDALMPAAGRS